MNSLQIKSNLRDYQVLLSKDLSFISELKELKNSVFIIDKKVWEIHQNTSLKELKGESVNKILFEALEENKNLEGVQILYDKIMELSPKKNLNIVSIGGGIIQDVTGFLSSTLYRGVNWIFIPTTLLAQDDSCIGAKTSLNYKSYKNLIGTFYPPSKIYISPQFLTTLTEKDFASGVGEMAKLHLLNGKDSTENFSANIENIFSYNEEILVEFLSNCINIKKSYIEEDEFDGGRRNLLNYGHCFGHAIESATNFSIPHGQAVVLGMIIANIVAKHRKIISNEIESFIRNEILTKIIRLDSNIILNLDKEKMIKAMKHDKKNVGNGLALVVTNDNYEFSKLTDIKEEEALEAINQFLVLYNESI